jgi:large repetitive protein
VKKIKQTLFAAALLAVLLAPSALAQTSDLTVTKTGPAAANADEDISYTVTVTNLGPAPATGITLTDAMPPGMTFVSATQDSGPSFVCTTPNPGDESGTVTCTTAAMADEESAVFTIVFHIRPDTAPGQSFENTASVTSVSPDPDNGNNSDSVITTLEVADLLLTKSGPDTASADSDVPYTITVTNLGPDTARTITLNDDIPEGMTFVSATQENGPAFDCSTPTPGDGGSVTCMTASMGAGVSAEFTFVFHIPDDAAPGTTFTNFVTVTSEFDPSDENNTGISSTTIFAPEADLAVTKTGPLKAGPDTDVVYSITLTNNGPTAAESVSLNDTLPGTLTFVSFEQNSGPTLNCTTPAIGAGGTINCSAATMPTGTAVFTLTAHVPADTVSFTEFTNTATVSTTTLDPNEENNSGSISTVVTAVDLSVTKTGPETANAGDQLVYTITLANTSQTPATVVTLTDAIPAGTTFVSFMHNGGPVPSCSTPNVGEGGTVTCTYAFFGTGSATFTLTVVTGDVAEVQNTATVMSEESFDTDTTNDSDTVTTTITPSADVSVAKSGPTVVNAGANMVYTILVSNDGVSAAANLTLTDVLPAGTTFVSLTPPNGPTFNCTTPAVDTNGTVTCTIASFPAGVTSTFELTVGVGQDVPSGTELSNTAVVSTTTPDADSGDDQSTVSTTVARNIDLLVTKAANSHVDAGANLTYLVSVLNSGPSPAANVTLTDVLPAGTTFVSNTQNSGPTFNCTDPAVGTSGTITCTLAELDPGVSAGFTFVVAVPASTPRDTVISNTASVASSTPSNPDNHPNQATIDVTVAVTADLSVTKTAPATVNAGQTLTYTIATANAGPSDAPSTTLEDVLPAGTTFVSILQDSGPTFNCTTPAVGANGTVTCTLASFAAGESAAFTLVVAVDPALAGGTTLDNTATVGAQAFDPDFDDRQSTASTTVNASADLGVEKTITPGGTAGDTITYTVTATNAGPSVATNVTLTDVLPSEVTFVSLNQASDPPFNCTTPAVGANGTITCTIASFDSGDTATFQIVVEVAQSVPEGTLISNTATIDADTPDPDPSDDSDTAAEGVITVADVGVTKSAPATVVAGETLTYTVNVANAGPSAARNVTLNDPLPEGTTFVSLSQPSGPTFNCNTPAPGTQATINCTLATMNAGETTTFSIVVRVSPDVANGTTLLNEVDISTSETDPDASNDTENATTTVTTSADVSVAKSGPATATATENVTYTVTVANAGPSAAQSVTLTDVVPANTTFVSASQTSGPTFNCTAPAAGATGTITCTIASLGANATAIFEFVVNVSPSTPNGTVITNTATVSSTTADPDGTDQTATATTSSATSADVGVAKTGPAMATAGSNATYTVTVRNDGPTEALSVTLTDAVPANTTFVSATQTGGPDFICTTPAPGATGTITCTIVSLAADTQATFDFVVNISPSAPDGTVVTNTAVVASATPDPDTTDQTASTNTTVGTGADVSISKSGPATVTSGSDITYTVTVVNAGPSNALNVVMTDAMPNGTTFVSTTQTGGPTFACTTPAVGANGTITCTIASLAANTTSTFELVFHVEPGTIGPIQNTASVSTATDTSPGNDAGSTSAAVAAGPTDVSIDKTASATSVGPAGSVAYTIVVRNNGPDNAEEVVVTDTLPAGTTLNSVSTTQGTCSGTTTITCNLGTLAPSVEATITLVVDFPATPGSFTNTASVDIGNVDTNPVNDSDDAVVSVAPTAQIPTLSPFALIALALALASVVLLRIR